MLRRKPALVVLATIGVLLVLGMFLWAGTKSEPPFTKGLRNNGYDAFIRASSLRGMVQPPASTNEYREFVKANREALAAVREGLKLRCELPAETYEQRNLALGVLSSFKGLANAMKVEGQYAEQQEKYGEAANTYLDIIRFGQKAEAGLLIHFLVGVAVESSGLRALEQLEPKLHGADRARVAAELKALQTSRLSFDEVLDRERYYMRRNSATPLHYLLGLHLTRAAVSKARERHEAHGQELARVAAIFAP